MEKQIISIVVDDGSKEPEDSTTKSSWVLSFNKVEPALEGALFFYLENTGDTDIKLDSISISSSAKASNIQVHTVYGEPSYTRESDVKPVNKRLTRGSNTPNIIAKVAANISELTSLGQLDRLELLKELTTYKTKPDITLTPNSAITITSESLGVLSGIITISTEE